MGDIDDEFICAAAVEPRHQVIGKFGAVNRESACRMRISGHRALRLRPSQDGQVPAWPVVETLRAWKVLILQSGQDQMPAMAGGKARNLDVISKQFRPRGMFVARNGRFRMVNVPAEKLLLIEGIREPR